ncbi:MAG: hypothetical protein EXS18_00430 [Verrucomicrobiae bacterium]|nr:hypothetical protein [Verrucomicrobiae bacterium]
MSAALQIAYTDFDRDYFALPSCIRDQMDRKIDDMGLRLRTYPHYRMKGMDRFRLRVGDHRIID